MIASSSFKPLHLLSRTEPPLFITPFPLLLSAETMENDSFCLWLLLSLVSREVCFEECPSGSWCYMVLLGFLLHCARHIGLRCRDKMVMLERRIPVCHLCLGMIQGADSQNSTTNGLRVGRREFGGSFLRVPVGCGQDVSGWRRQPVANLSHFSLVSGLWWKALFVIPVFALGSVEVRHLFVCLFVFVYNTQVSRPLLKKIFLVSI